MGWRHQAIPFFIILTSNRMKLYKFLAFLKFQNVIFIFELYKYIWYPGFKETIRGFLFMKRIVCLMVFLGLPPLLAFSQLGYRVPDDYIKINDAIQASLTGSLVFIGPGVYDRDSQDFPIDLKEGITIQGSGYAQTFIDTGGTGSPAFLVQNVSVTDTVIKDLTVQNGDLNLSGGAGLIVLNTTSLYLFNVRFLHNKGINGGAIYMSNSTIYARDCIFDGNQAQNGGAVYVESPGSAPIFSRNTFVNNRATQIGGAFYIRQASGAGIYRNTFSQNQAGNRAGALMIIDGSPEFLENILEENTAPNGGGMILQNSRSPLQRNTFLKNRAGTGGGIFSVSGEAEIMNNKFMYNEATILGAAYATQGSSDKFLNNVVHHNRNQTGAGAAVSMTNSTADFVNNTVANNWSDAGLGLFNSPIAVFNNIFAFNSGSGLLEYDLSSDPNCQHNLFYQNSTANYMDETAIPMNTAAEINAASNPPHVPHANIVGDPMFKDALMGDYHLRAASPAREAATFFPPSFPEQDIDAEVRNWGYSGALPDIGADEISFPHIIEPVIFYDTDGSHTVSRGDQIVLTFTRPVDAPTSLSAAEFFLPVMGDSLSTGTYGQVSPLNPRQVVITLGNSTYLTIPGIYNDANTTPGSPSGIDIALAGPVGLQDEEGLRASPLGPPGPNTTGMDIALAIDQDMRYTGWYSSSTIESGVNGYYQDTRLEIPILSSYYEGFLTMRQAKQYFGATNTIAFEGTFGLFIFDPLNPPTLTMKYSENEIDPSRGEREEQMRIFRLNRNNPDYPYFELVPGSLDRPQVVDTINNTVSVTLTYLYPPRNPPYVPGYTIPVSPDILDESDGIYAVFPVKPFEEVSKRAHWGSPDDRVVLAADHTDPYFSHEIIIPGFREDAAGSVTLAMRLPRPNERDLFSDKTNAVLVVEAKELDGITPVDIASTPSVIMHYKDHHDSLFSEDIVDVHGIKGSEPQLVIFSVDPETWTLGTASGNDVFRNPISNLLTGDIAPDNIYSGRFVIGALVSETIPFTYDFHYYEDGWTFVKDIDPFDSGIPGNGSGFLSIAGATDYTFSFWNNDPDELPVVEGYVYRMRIPVSSDLYSQNTCPSFRLRVNSQNNQLIPKIRVMSNREGYSCPAVEKPKIYDLYFIPPYSAIGAPSDQDDLQVSFDFVNLDPNDEKNATLFFKGVQIDRIPLESLTPKATLATYDFIDTTDGWVSGGAPQDFSLPTFSQTGSSLYMGVLDNQTFGYWERDTEISLSTDTLYCARFFVFTDVRNREETPDVRFRVSTKNFMQVSILREQNFGTADMAPTRIPQEYVVYFYPEQELLKVQIRETILLSVDVINLSPKGEAGNGIYIDRVVLEAYDPPAWPY